MIIFPDAVLISLISQFFLPITDLTIQQAHSSYHREYHSLSPTLYHSWYLFCVCMYLYQLTNHMVNAGMMKYITYSNGLIKNGLEVKLI